MLYLRPKITYPIPCCSFTPQQCRFIQALALEALLPKLHLNRHSPGAVLFGGPKYGGLQLPDLYADQGIGQLNLLIGHLKLGDEVGNQLKGVLSCQQLVVGSDKPFFALPFPLYEKWITETWLVSIWCYLSLVKVTIDIENQWLPSLSREHDSMTMDLAITLNLSPTQLKEINSCRIYLQVLTLSNISVANGKSLTVEAQAGVRDQSRLSKHSWPNSKRPKQWGAWHLFLQHVSTGVRLTQPLGRWLHTPHQQWTWFLEPEGRHALHFDPLTLHWTSYRPLLVGGPSTRRQTHYYGSPELLIGFTPTTLLPASSWEDSRGIRIDSSSSSFPASEAPIVSSLWEESQISAVFHDTPVFFQRLIGSHPPIMEACDEIAEEISYNSLVTCSDRAHNPDTSTGSHAWVLASAVRGTMSSGSGVDDGHPALMSSYWSELGGVLALLCIIYRICKYYDLSSGKTVFYCDNKGAIGNSFKSAPPGITPFFQADYDLLGLIHELVTLIPITVVGNWVKGHYTRTER
jgi:hypothetical protein